MGLVYFILSYTVSLRESERLKLHYPTLLKYLEKGALKLTKVRDNKNKNGQKTLPCMFMYDITVKIQRWKMRKVQSDSFCECYKVRDPSQKLGHNLNCKMKENEKCRCTLEIHW